MTYSIEWLDYCTNDSVQKVFHIQINNKKQHQLYLHLIYGNLHRPVYPTRHEPSVHNSVSVSTCYRMIDDINLSVCIHSLWRYSRSGWNGCFYRPYLLAPMLVCWTFCEMLLKAHALPFYPYRDQGWVPVPRCWIVAMTPWHPQLWLITHTHCHVALQNKVLLSSTANPKRWRRASVSLCWDDRHSQHEYCAVKSVLVEKPGVILCATQWL